MRWPWKISANDKHLVISWSGQTLAYVLACGNAVNGYTVLESAVKRDCAVDLKELASDLKAFNLDGLEVSVMLRPGQYQLLQIESPTVAPDELRAAARYQIRDMLDIPIDEVRLDLIRVGDGQQKGAAQLFVVATPMVVIRNVLDLCKAMRWKASVIDIHEMAQRNLQTALAGRNGNTTQAQPALVWVDEFQAVLTISANGELFNTRRFDFLQGLSAGFWDTDINAAFVESHFGFSGSVGDELGYSKTGIPSKINMDVTNQYIGASTPVDNIWSDNQAQRFLMELKRSFDLWERLWPSMPLGAMWLHAGRSSEELATWLSPKLEQKVQLMDVKLLFSDFNVSVDDEALCLPLLGILLRTENRTF